MDKFAVDELRVGEMGRKGQMGREFWALNVEMGGGGFRESEFGGVRESHGRTVENSDWGLEFSGRDGRVWRESGRQQN